MTNQSLRNLINYIKKRYFFYIENKDSVLSYLHLDDLTDTIINISSAVVLYYEWKYFDIAGLYNPIKAKSKLSKI